MVFSTYLCLSDKKRNQILTSWMKCQHQNLHQEGQVKGDLKEVPRRKPLVWMEYSLIYVGTENLKRWRSKHRKMPLIIHEFAWMYNNVLYSCNLLRILKFVKYIVRCMEFSSLICMFLCYFFWFLFRMWAPDCLIWSLFISGPDVRWSCDEYSSQALFKKKNVFPTIEGIDWIMWFLAQNTFIFYIMPRESTALDDI